MNLAEITHVLTLVCLLFLVAGGVHMFMRSRTWTLPVQSARIDMLMDEQRVIRGNLRRVERDTSEWHQQVVDTQDAILKELQAIQRNGAKEHPLEDEMHKIEERLLDLEQVLSTLPCTPACPIPEDEKK